MTSSRDASLARALTRAHTLHPARSKTEDKVQKDTVVESRSARLRELMLASAHHDEKWEAGSVKSFGRLGLEPHMLQPEKLRNGKVGAHDDAEGVDTGEPPLAGCTVGREQSVLDRTNNVGWVATEAHMFVSAAPTQ